MSSSSTTDQTSHAEPQHQQQQQQQDPPSDNKTPLPLPSPSSADNETTSLNVNGEAVKLDRLGPLVVNKDGTLSRIANWEHMAEIERKNTLRILGKRNQLRTEVLRGGSAGGEGGEGSS